MRKYSHCTEESAYGTHMAQFELFANTYKNGMHFLYTFSVYPKYIFFSCIFNVTIHLYRKMSEFNTMRFNILKQSVTLFP